MAPFGMSRKLGETARFHGVLVRTNRAACCKSATGRGQFFALMQTRFVAGKASMADAARRQCEKSVSVAMQTHHKRGKGIR